jgi:hypothetical protein
LTCYFRHLKEIFQRAGIEVTRENKQEVDKLIQQVVKTEHKNCPETWKEEKTIITPFKEDGTLQQMAQQFTSSALASPLLWL